MDSRIPHPGIGFQTCVHMTRCGKSLTQAQHLKGSETARRVLVRSRSGSTSISQGRGWNYAAVGLVEFIHASFGVRPVVKIEPDRRCGEQGR